MFRRQFCLRTIEFWIMKFWKPAILKRLSQYKMQQLRFSIEWANMRSARISVVQFDKCSGSVRWKGRKKKYTKRHFSKCSDNCWRGVFPYSFLRRGAGSFSVVNAKRIMTRPFSSPSLLFPGDENPTKLYKHFTDGTSSLNIYSSQWTRVPQQITNKAISWIRLRQVPLKVKRKVPWLRNFAVG